MKLQGIGETDSRVVGVTNVSFHRYGGEGEEIKKYYYDQLLLHSAVFK